MSAHSRKQIALKQMRLPWVYIGYTLIIRERLFTFHYECSVCGFKTNAYSRKKPSYACLMCVTKARSNPCGEVVLE
jgi:hypothetical protein